MATMSMVGAAKSTAENDRIAFCIDTCDKNPISVHGVDCFLILKGPVVFHRTFVV